MQAPSDQYLIEQLEGVTAAALGKPAVEVIPPGDPDEIMREQLEELIEHSRSCSARPCARCERHALARALLLAVFV